MTGRRSVRFFIGITRKVREISPEIFASDLFRSITESLVPNSTLISSLKRELILLEITKEGFD
jgi:hypothetical protein